MITNLAVFLSSIVVIDVATPSYRNIKKQKHEKYGKYQGLKEEVEKVWRRKTSVVPVVTAALTAVIPKLGESF